MHYRSSCATLRVLGDTCTKHHHAWNKNALLVPDREPRHQGRGEGRRRARVRRAAPVRARPVCADERAPQAGLHRHLPHQGINRSAQRRPRRVKVVVSPVQREAVFTLKLQRPSRSKE